MIAAAPAIASKGAAAELAAFGEEEVQEQDEIPDAHRHRRQQQHGDRPRDRIARPGERRRQFGHGGRAIHEPAQEGRIVQAAGGVSFNST